jgi:hypothetical protein
MRSIHEQGYTTREPRYSRNQIVWRAIATAKHNSRIETRGETRGKSLLRDLARE